MIYYEILKKILYLLIKVLTKKMYSTKIISAKINERQRKFQYSENLSLKHAATYYFLSRNKHIEKYFRHFKAPRNFIFWLPINMFKVNGYCWNCI